VNVQLFIRQLYSSLTPNPKSKHAHLAATQRLRRAFCTGKALVPFVDQTSLKLNLTSCKISFWDGYLPRFFLLDFFIFFEEGASGDEEKSETCCLFLKAAHRFFNLAHFSSWSKSEYLLACTNCELMQLV
jgi:hypothetical protein